MQRQRLGHLKTKSTPKSSCATIFNILSKLTTFVLLLVSENVLIGAAAADKSFTTEIKHFRPGIRDVTVSPNDTVHSYPGCLLSVSDLALDKRTDNEIEIRQHFCSFEMVKEEEYIGSKMLNGVMSDYLTEMNGIDTLAHHYDFNKDPNIVLETLITSKPITVNEPLPYKSNTLIQFRLGNNRRYLAQPDEEVRPSRACKLAVTGNALDRRTSTGIQVTQKQCMDKESIIQYSGTVFRNNTVTEKWESPNNGSVTTQVYDLMDPHVVRNTRSYRLR